MTKLILKVQKVLLREAFRLFEPRNFSFFSTLCRAPLWNRKLLKRIDERKCVFVQIPKSAGRSVSQSIFGCYGTAHRSIQDYQNILSSNAFNEYFKFSIVRNPWDRLVSAFFFHKNGGCNRWDKKWLELNLSSYADFDSFVHGWVNKENIMTWFAFVPQYQYIYLKNGKMPLDFIGCYENLDVDFLYVCNRLNTKVELLRINTSRPVGDDYRKHYTEETQRIVSEAYAEDIRILGYSFDLLPPKICKVKS